MRIDSALLCRQWLCLAKPFPVLTLAACSLLASVPQAHAEDAPDVRPAEIYKTFYLSHLASNDEANQVQTDLRNMLPHAKIYFVPARSALSMRGSEEDMGTAEKMLADLDRERKLYRLHYTITELDGDKAVGTRHLSLIASPGVKAELKEGSKVPLAVGMPGEHPDVQYQDVGIGIEATLDAEQEGVGVHSKIYQSSVAEERSGLGAQDPIFRQATLEGVAVVTPGKAATLGTLDVPGTTHQQRIEVTAEPVR